MNFLDVSDPCCSPEQAAVRILPVPYEGTVTYGSGTAKGPAAILEASAQVELYDEFLGTEPWRCGIATLSPLNAASSPEPMVRAVEQAVSDLVDPNRLVVTLGGEHSISPGAVAAHVKHGFPAMGVIQFDAHADLRASYQGSVWNHACAMSRIHDIVPPRHCLQLGIRSLSSGEGRLIRSLDNRVLFARDIMLGATDISDLLAALPRCVYITFDVDVFDPSIISATGTPEPGGLDWYTTLNLLEQIFDIKRVVGFDIVELTDENTASAFTMARLLYRMIGLWGRA